MSDDARAAPTWTIGGGRVLGPEGFTDRDLGIAEGRFAAPGAGRRRLDACGLLVLPGIVDVHGDAFERQVMPRPGIHFDLATALVDTDRQLVANGVTTAFHGVTRSWEPGLRGAENARALLAAIAAMNGRLAADTRFHLRHETFNLDGEAEILDWIAAGRIGCLAFNDHTTGMVEKPPKPRSLATMIERSGLEAEDFAALFANVASRAAEVPASIARLAAAARSAGLAMLSHDDMSPAMRAEFRALGVGVAEFPTNEATAAESIAAGEAVVFGAPNVLRGGSHTGAPRAADMVAKGLCTVLASDYYYPALPTAPFRLARDGVTSLDAAWALVSANPAAAMGLSDRGRIDDGLRADAVVIDANAADGVPRVVATFAGGRLVHLSDGARLG